MLFHQSSYLRSKRYCCTLKRKVKPRNRNYSMNNVPRLRKNQYKEINLKYIDVSTFSLIKYFYRNHFIKKRIQPSFLTNGILIAQENMLEVTRNSSE